MLTHVTYKSTWGSNHQKSPADGFSQRKSAPCLAGQKDRLRSLSILRTLVPGKLLLQHHQQVASSASRAKHFDKSTPWEPVKARADRCWWRSWISHDHRYSAGAVEKTHFWWTPKQVDRWDSTWPTNIWMVSWYQHMVVGFVKTWGIWPQHQAILICWKSLSQAWDDCWG